jgi:hypothetical protein
MRRKERKEGVSIIKVINYGYSEFG